MSDADNIAEFTWTPIELAENSLRVNHETTVQAISSANVPDDISNSQRVFIQETVYAGVVESARLQEEHVRFLFNGFLRILNRSMNEIIDKVDTIRSELVQTQMVTSVQDTMLDSIRTTADNAIKQLNALPAGFGQGGGAPARPKSAQPPIFDGKKDSTKLEEWKNLVELWNSTQGVTTDKQRMINALSLMREPALKLMQPLLDKNAKGESMGTIDAFWSKLQSVYGQKDVTRTATKDLEKLLNDTSPFTVVLDRMHDWAQYWRS